MPFGYETMGRQYSCEPAHIRNCSGKTNGETATIRYCRLHDKIRCLGNHTQTHLSAFWPIADLQLTFTLPPVGRKDALVPELEAIIKIKPKERIVVVYHAQSLTDVFWNN